MSANLDRLREAYQVWATSKGTNLQVWRELLDHSFVMQSVARDPLGLDFAGTVTGPTQLERAFTNLLATWDMNLYRVDTLIEDGDKIAMFGEVNFTFKKTGKSAQTPIANLWEFRDGKAVKLIEIFDSARAAMAAMPG